MRRPRGRGESKIPPVLVWNIRSDGRGREASRPGRPGNQTASPWGARRQKTRGRFHGGDSLGTHPSGGSVRPSGSDRDGVEAGDGAFHAGQPRRDPRFGENRKASSGAVRSRQGWRGRSSGAANGNVRPGRACSQRFVCFSFPTHCRPGPGTRGSDPALERGTSRCRRRGGRGRRRQDDLGPGLSRGRRSSGRPHPTG